MRQTRALAGAGAVALVGLLTGVTPCGAGVSWAVEGRAVTVEVLPGLGGRVDWASDINERGQVVGSSSLAGGGSRGVLWDDGEVVDLTPDVGEPPAPFGSGEAVSVNERGTVAGSLYTRETTRPVGWVWRDGERTALPGVDGTAQVVEVNDAGQVLHAVGRVGTATAGTRIWDDGAVAEAPALPGGGQFHGVDLNRHGAVVGYSTDGFLAGADAYVWRPGRDPVALGRLVEGTRTWPIAINDRGDVLGREMIGGYIVKAFHWSDGRIVDLGTLGGDLMNVGPGGPDQPSPLNDRGEVVGSSETAAGDMHAFLWRDGRMVDLGTLGGTFSHASGVNNRGQVVGHSWTESGEMHAFLWQSGRMIDLTEAVGRNFHVTDLNDRGEVVGVGTGPDGTRSYVVRVPPPA